jgi:hypothetical protein
MRSCKIIQRRRKTRAMTTTFEDETIVSLIKRNEISLFWKEFSLSPSKDKIMRPNA